jgi:polar amino acid transport system permease protein
MAPGGRRERVAQASARVPFRLKVAAVWIAIFALLTFLFARAQFDTQLMRDRADFILGGLRNTIIIAVVSIALAIVLALIGALGRLSRNPVAYGVSGFYTSFFRGTPLIVQIFFIAFALPIIVGNLGLPTGLREFLTIDAWIAGILALGLNYGAYMTEIFRAGIQSVSHGQAEAADALGMSYRQKMRRVVLPQALRVIIPPTGNEFIAMMKDTALVSFAGVAVEQSEIFRRAQLVGSREFQPIEAYLLAAAMYWALTALFTFFQAKLERRLSKGYLRGDEGKARSRWMPGGGTGGASGGGVVVELPVEDAGPAGIPGQGH